MRYACGVAISVFRMLAAASPIPKPSRQGWSGDPDRLAQFGLEKAPPTPDIDWTAVAFSVLWASVIVTVLVLWYRQMRFQQGLESAPPRRPSDEG